MIKTLKNQTVLLVFLIIFSILFGYIIGDKGYIGNILDNNIIKENSKDEDVKIGNKDIDLTLFNESYRIIAENYYSFSNISSKDLVLGMIKGIVGALNDKHSEYFNIDETKQFNEVLNGDFEGIGAVIQKNDFGVFIDRIIAGSPAKEAGLLSGDIIIKANGIDLKDINLTDAVNKIKGKAGTKVSLEIIRPGEKEILKLDVIRRKITIPSVDSKILDNNTGYIMLSIFGEKTGDEFKKTLDDLYSKNISGLIIDLRDNGGGYLETSVSILSNFIDKDKVLVTTKEKNPLNNRSYFSIGNNNKKIPIVVLINENSASASEITAGALKDYNLGVIVGMKSYGKGSVQEPFTLSDGSELKITIAKWFTPLDHGIDGIGINPDIEVKFKQEDIKNNFDRQLDEAKKALQKYIELGDIKKTIGYYNDIKKMEENRKITDITNSGSSSAGTGSLKK
ncbi:MAG: S41 family peptidase [Candidatus Gracilibacteria bacterium]|nr:S41 family peptidase [Candidatus Gracilibacteria bacterium]